MEKMNCYFCGGEMKKGKTTYTINKKGYHLLIDEVQAWICKQCGEPYFEGNVVDAIQKLVGELDTRVENVREVALAY
jgi:YgiT-type zinc finger domain-containing protein